MSRISHDSHRVRNPATDELKDHEHEADASDEDELVECSIALG